MTSQNRIILDPPENIRGAFARIPAPGQKEARVAWIAAALAGGASQAMIAKSLGISNSAVSLIAKEFAAPPASKPKGRTRYQICVIKQDGTTVDHVITGAPDQAEAVARATRPYPGSAARTVIDLSQDGTQTASAR